MSELNIKVRKSQDNGSTFRATPDTLYMGGVGSAKVDTLHFEVPEEWAGCAITLHVQRLSGALPDPQMLDENNCVVVDRRWTQEKQGSWMLLAVDENGYIAMTKPGQYTCYETIDTNSTTETITPSVYEQFVALVKKWGQAAVDAARAAKESEERAAGSASASAGSAAAAARSESASAGSATAAAGSASEAAGSAGSAKQDADRAAEAANNAANAATDALKKAKDAGDFKGDKGDTGPQGPSGTIIRAYDITLPAADWAETSDDEAKAAGWSYQCDATVSGCTAELEPSATISVSSVPDAQKAGLGTICRTGAGYCRFYAATVPSADIHLRLLLMERVPTLWGHVLWHSEQATHSAAYGCRLLARLSRPAAPSARRLTMPEPVGRRSRTVFSWARAAATRSAAQADLRATP